jgi:hypothetical protein
MPFLKIISAQSVFSLLDAFQPIWVVLAIRTAARGHLVCLLDLTIISMIAILLIEILWFEILSIEILWFEIPWIEILYA